MQNTNRNASFWTKNFFVKTHVYNSYTLQCTYLYGDIGQAWMKLNYRGLYSQYTLSKITSFKEHYFVSCMTDHHQTEEGAIHIQSQWIIVQAVLLYEPIMHNVLFILLHIFITNWYNTWGRYKSDDIFSESLDVTDYLILLD